MSITGRHVVQIRRIIIHISSHASMNRPAILGACVAVLALSRPTLAQTARDSVLPAGRISPLIASSRLASTGRVGFQLESRSTEQGAAPGPTSRRYLKTGAITGLAIGAIGLTVRDLSEGDGNKRNVGRDGAIVISTALIGALANYMMHSTRDDGPRSR